MFSSCELIGVKSWIYVSITYVIIALDNRLLFIQHQAIIQTSDGFDWTLWNKWYWLNNPEQIAVKFKS